MIIYILKLVLKIISIFNNFLKNQFNTFYKVNFLLKEAEKIHFQKILIKQKIINHKIQIKILAINAEI